MNNARINSMVSKYDSLYYAVVVSSGRVVHITCKDVSKSAVIALAQAYCLQSGIKRYYVTD